MFISLYQLLAVKQGEVEARRGYLEALRDYWIARAELARALGGAFAASRPRLPRRSPLRRRRPHRLPQSVTARFGRKSSACALSTRTTKRWPNLDRRHEHRSAAQLSRRALLLVGTAGGAVLAGARAAIAADVPGAEGPRPGSAAASGKRSADPRHLPPGRPGRDYLPVIVPNGAKLPWKVVDGVKVFHLVAEEVEHEFAPGLKAKCWGYNGRVHGPVIEAVEGDRVRIYVTNRLPAADDRALARHPAAERHGRRRRPHPEGDPARRDVQVRVHAPPARARSCTTRTTTR